MRVNLLLCTGETGDQKGLESDVLQLLWRAIHCRFLLRELVLASQLCWYLP